MNMLVVSQLMETGKQIASITDCKFYHAEFWGEINNDLWYTCNSFFYESAYASIANICVETPLHTIDIKSIYDLRIV